MEVAQGSRCQEGYIFFYFQGEFHELNLNDLMTCADFHLAWAFHGVMSPKSLTQMPFGIKQQGIIDTTQVLIRALLLGILVYE